MSTRIATLLLLSIFAGPMAFAEKPAEPAITPIGNLERGMYTTISGEVIRILDEDEFRLQDETGSVKVYIGWKNRVDIPIGEKVIVRGIVDDDFRLAFRPEFYASEIIRADGTVKKLKSSD
jgi:uncharacterized protein YdeI (BOF family)